MVANPNFSDSTSTPNAAPRPRSGIVYAGWACKVEGLNPVQKAVLTSVASFADAHGVCWPAVMTIAKRAGTKRRATQINLRGLECLGLLRTQGGIGGRSKSTVYRLNLGAAVPEERAHQMRPLRKNTQSDQQLEMPLSATVHAFRAPFSASRAPFSLAPGFSTGFGVQFVHKSVDNLGITAETGSERAHERAHETTLKGAPDAPKLYREVSKKEAQEDQQDKNPRGRARSQTMEPPGIDGHRALSTAEPVPLARGIAPVEAPPDAPDQETSTVETSAAPEPLPSSLPDEALPPAAEPDIPPPAPAAAPPDRDRGMLGPRPQVARRIAEAMTAGIRAKAPPRSVSMDEQLVELGRHMRAEAAGEAPPPPRPAARAPHIPDPRQRSAAEKAADASGYLARQWAELEARERAEAEGMRREEAA